jgi:pyroglutamyl-peptidase
MQPTIVVTGFEAFGAYPLNPTAEVVRRLARAPLPTGRLVPLVLPVTWSGAAAVLLARMAREGAHGCLLFGLAAESRAMRVERCAHNRMEAGGADNAGVQLQGESIVPEGAAQLWTDGPYEAVQAALVEAGAPVAYSDDPGRFVCNATYYRALATEAGRRAVFVHVPATRALGGALEEATLAAWMQAAIEGYLAGLRAK